MIRRDNLDLGLIEELATQIFPRAARLAVERVEEGVSTHVYRIRRNAEVFYLRVLQDGGKARMPNLLREVQWESEGGQEQGATEDRHLGDLAGKSRIIEGDDLNPVSLIRALRCVGCIRDKCWLCIGTRR